MKAPVIAAGELLALSRSLTSAADPLALYSALSEGGTRPNTLLIETQERALIVERAALKISCRGQEVELLSLTHGGRLLLQPIARELALYCSERADDKLKLRFPRTTSDNSDERLRAPSPFDALRALTLWLSSLSPQEPFGSVLAGIIAFDHVDLFEDLPEAREDPLSFPDFLFWVPESLILIERGAPARIICTAFGSNEEVEATRSFHSAAERLSELFKRCSSLSSAAPEGHKAREAAPAPQQDEPTTDLEDGQFADLVERLKTHIRAGDVYQIVPSRSFTLPCEKPLEAFACQRAKDPSPYMFFVNAGEEAIFGASPETAVTLTGDNQPIVRAKPIAGTRPRGATLDEDDRLEADLRLDEKEVAEHMMLVDLARNDVARVSIAGTRRVSKLLSVERFARVMHLVSEVEGELRPELDAFHALHACLNVGTLSGAPKLRAIELLRSYERTKRGPYGGAIGWISSSGAMDTGVIIRSAVVKNGLAHVRAGAGIVQDSDPLAEARETRAKASVILEALEVRP